MSSSAIITATKMLETLPESVQKEAVERLREYIAEIQDEQLWDQQFERTQDKLESFADEVLEALAEGGVESMDFKRK